LFHINLLELTFKNVSLRTRNYVNGGIKSELFLMENVACGNHLIVTAFRNCVPSFDLQQDA